LRTPPGDAGGFRDVWASYLTGITVSANIVSVIITAVQSAVVAIENEVGATAGRNYVGKDGAVTTPTPEQVHKYPRYHGRPCAERLCAGISGVTGTPGQSGTILPRCLAYFFSWNSIGAKSVRFRRHSGHTWA
jgi:hypothetical protein